MRVIITIIEFMEYAQCELRLKYSKVLCQSALGILCKSNENVIISRISWYNIHSTKIVLIIFNTITYCSVCNVDICHPYTVQKLHIAFHLLSVYFCIFMVMFVYTRQSQNSSSTCTNCFEVKRLKCLSNSIKTYTFECEFYNSVLSKLFTMDMAWRKIDHTNDQLFSFNSLRNRCKCVIFSP